MNFKKKEINEVLRQVSRFDKLSIYPYKLKILTFCIKRRKNIFSLDKKTFLKYLEAYSKKKVKMLQNDKYLLEKIFLKELKNILTGLKKLLKGLYKKIMFFYISKVRINLEKLISNMEYLFKKIKKHLKTLNLRKRDSYGVILYKQILSKALNFFSYTNEIFMGQVISKIYENIVKKISTRASLKFFFNQALVISANSILFGKNFIVPSNFLKDRILNFLYFSFKKRNYELQN